MAEKKATEAVNWADEEKSLKEQLEVAKELDRDGVEERIRIYGELAAGKAKEDEKANKGVKNKATQALKDASKVSIGTTTFDKGTGQAVDAYEAAIQRVRTWREENAKLIAKFPELGQKGKDAIEQLRLKQASAEVARLAKNFGDLQREIKLDADKAVTTSEKIAATDEALKKIKAAKGKNISDAQAEQLTGPLEEKSRDLTRQKEQEDLQHQQEMRNLRAQGAEQELAIIESLADGTLRSNDKLLIANEKLHQFKLKALQDERDAAIAAGEDKLQTEERYQQQAANLERQRTDRVSAAEQGTVRGQARGAAADTGRQQARGQEDRADLWCVRQSRHRLHSRRWKRGGRPQEA